MCVYVCVWRGREEGGGVEVRTVVKGKFRGLKCMFLGGKLLEVEEGVFGVFWRIFGLEKFLVQL